MGPGSGLTALSEKVLDLGNGGMGLHLWEAQATETSAGGAQTQDPGSLLVRGMDWRPGQLLWAWGKTKVQTPTHSGKGLAKWLQPW